MHLLVGAGRDPSAFAGALLPPALAGGSAATARWGAGDTFVVEADEYAGNFDPYIPSVVILLNVDWDHPDVFADRAAVVAAFDRWLRRAAQEPGAAERVLVANTGDEGVAELLERLSDWPGKTITVALDMPADVSASLEIGAEGRSRLRVRQPDGSDKTFEVGLAGRHNAANALAVMGAARALAVGEEDVRRSLAGFPGVGRRLELKGEAEGVLVLDDYGHHPTAIARTLEAVRMRYPGRRLWAVYEPLTYHRTAHMLTAFADVLSTADAVAVADIWASRDTDTTIVSSAALAEEITRRGGPAAAAPGSVEATADYLAARVEPGDVVLVMGGGRSHVIATRLLAQLRGRAGGDGRSVASI